MKSKKPTIRDLAKDRRYLPSTALNYFLGFQGNKASLYATGNSSPLIMIDDCKEFGATATDPRVAYNNQDFLWDKRVQFIAEANLLVTIPPEGGQMMLRRLMLSAFETIIGRLSLRRVDSTTNGHEGK